VLDNLILSNTFRSGVVGLAKTLSQELGKDGILVNVIGPGRIDTPRIEQLDKIRADRTGVSMAELQQNTFKTIPLGRYGRPEEYGKLAVFLCSQANTYITGQSVLVDGGLIKAV
jgi:3-oxoacyl-[acyl-carrier protein] reductase